MGNLIGEVSGVVSAFCWALSNVLIKTQTDRMDAITINILRCLAATIFFPLVLLLSGRVGELSQLSLPVVFLLIASSVLGLGVGDTIYFRSLALIGVSRSYPLTNVSVVFTATIAFIFLNEEFTWFVVLGGALILGGVYLIAIPPRGKEPVELGHPDPKVMVKGTLMVIVASVFWALSITTSKIALESVSSLTANIVRLPVLSLLFFVIYPSKIGVFKPRRYPLRSLLVVLASGVIGVGIGSYLFLYSVQQAGAAKASILISISPLFATVISLIFLKEKINLRIGLGALLSVVGVWFLV